MNPFVRVVHAILAEWRFLAGAGRSTLLVLLGIPLVYPLIISWLYMADAAVQRPLLIVDEDGSALSRRVTLGLDATQELALAGRPTSAQAGFDAIRRGEAEVLVLIPDGFSTRIKRGEQAAMKLWVNGANMLTYAAALPGVTNVIQDLNEDLGRRHLGARGQPTVLAERRVMPIARSERFLFHPRMGYGSFLIPGVLLIVIQQVVLLGLTYSVGLARETAPSTAAAPAHAVAFAASKAAAQFPLFVVGAAFLVFAVFPAFGWPARHHGAMFLLFVAVAIAMLPIGVLVAAWARDRWTAFLVLMFVSAPPFMATGFAWPEAQIPAWLRIMMDTVPLKPGMAAVRILSNKSGALADVAPQFAHLALQTLAWSLAALAIATIASYRRRAPATTTQAT